MKHWIEIIAIFLLICFVLYALTHCEGGGLLQDFRGP